MSVNFSRIRLIAGRLLVGSAVTLTIPAARAQHSQESPGARAQFAGSVSCRECHEKFYQLWSTSHHGLAMQPYTAAFAATRLTSQTAAIAIGETSYRADVERGVVLETAGAGTKAYRMEHVLGGKNVFYFLTLLDKGRLQTLPVAYDVHKKEWLDTAASGVRHIPGQTPEQPVHWKEWPYTFNASCYGCHVSQLSTNYDAKSDTYHTTWREPGINCEACHGPGEEHNKIARATPKGQPLADLKIISTKTMTVAQRNDLCASCHAKVTALTASFTPGDRFHDHFALVTLEDADYYPDGRDLGENYTFTSWRLSPCVKSGKLDCMHCHTSSGRYRFQNENVNGACLPCHAEHVANPPAHTRHKNEKSVDAVDVVDAGKRQRVSPANQCVSCHMPMTKFARMNRSDHSMLPPAPAATLAFGSPNACNLCHTDEDKDAAWADRTVRQWRTRDYQAPVLERAGLIAAARKAQWARLPEMLEYIARPDRDEIFAASLLRLVAASGDRRVCDAAMAAMKDSSPLVRAAAAEALALMPTPETGPALLSALDDSYRLVRIRAAAGLVEYPRERLPADAAGKLARGQAEYLAFIMARPDQWTSHYNLGNYHLSRGELNEAVASFDKALTFEPQAVMAMVNASMAYAQMGDTGKTAQALERALRIAPDSAAANFNMGLLMAEQNDLAAAERHLRRALKADPTMAQAAYNLAVILGEDRLGEAIELCRQAAQLRRDEPKYAYTLAFYLHRAGEKSEAAAILAELVQRHPQYTDAQALLTKITRSRR